MGNVRVVSSNVAENQGPSAESLGPARRENLAARAYDRILGLVLSGGLPGGAPLQERRLAELLDISRTPIREALGRLETDGVVERHAGRFLKVREISAQEMIEVLLVRELLEVKAAAIAAERIDPATVARLVDDVERALRGGPSDAAHHWAVDDAIHDAIARASGNGVLRDLVRDLRLRTRLFDVERMPDRFVPGLHEHLAILEALAKRDAAAAQAAMAKHIANVRDSIVRKLSHW